MFEECAFIAVTTPDLAEAKRFWVGLLGFAIVREDENYLMVDAGGVRLCFDLPDGALTLGYTLSPLRGSLIRTSTRLLSQSPLKD
jgi:catechol 2,3-dioxygenase-like lactoylglutathione lyase family enzyme